MEIQINTSCGPIKGTQERDNITLSFKGIRYAAAGRWEYPKPVTHWNEVYNATKFGSCAYQPRAFFSEEGTAEKSFYYNEFRKGEAYSYSEDCLFLNIWTPKNAQNASVLFYIHGGGFVGGCGHEKHFDGAALCKLGVIVVTINYRLGPMGFCCLPELAQEAGHTGNYAMFDQLCALQWVRNNIKAFGGNCDKITIMGQSAGAISVQQMVVSPLAKGLFSGAIMLSGGGISAISKPITFQKAYPFWEELCFRLNAADINALRAVEPKRLFLVFQALYKEQKNKSSVCAPVLDSLYLPFSAANAAKASKQADVPYLMGCTSEDIAPAILYKMAKNWAQLQARQHKHPSYCYFFRRQLPGDKKGAWHSSDLWYVFGTLHKCWRPFSAWDYSLSDIMVRYIANFVKKDDPNEAELPLWQPIKNKQSKMLLLGNSDIKMGDVNIAKLIYTMLSKPTVGE